MLSPVAHPLDTPPTVQTMPDEVNSLTTKTISLKWRMTALTDQPTALVDIELVGYYENTNWVRNSSNSFCHVFFLQSWTLVHLAHFSHFFFVCLSGHVILLVMFIKT